MGNVSRQWADLGMISRSTSLSTDQTLRSGTTSNSSPARSIDCGNTHQAPAPDKIANSTVAVLHDVPATHNGGEEESKHCCMHPSHPENNRPKFTANKDLKRHQKEHDDQAIRWHCGCRQNLGKKFKPNTRKDKVQHHLRNIHEKPKSEGNRELWIECPERGCYTLFIAAYCLDEHWRQNHAGHLQEKSHQTTTDSKCDCKQSAEYKRMQESLYSETKKHGATSPLESSAKRKRLETAEYQNQCSDLVPQSIGFPPSAMWPIDSPNSTPWTDIFSPTSNHSSLIPTIQTPNLGYHSMDLSCHPANWGGATDSFGNGVPDMNQGIDLLRGLAPMDTFHVYAQTPPHQLFIGDSKPADFLAIRKTQEFQGMVITLRQLFDEYLYPPINPITYNPGKEILTLRAYSESNVEKAMTDVRLLFENFSMRCGRKYLGTSYPSTSRALPLDSSSTHGSTGSRTARVFPIKPKEDRRLVQFWFKSVLPALPKILSERLGERYSVSLVRRGQSDLRAEPCIQIGSPCVPGQKAQTVIKDLVSKIWETEGHEPIPMRFIEGSIKKLSGVEGADDDDGGESADFQLLDFNYNRPYSKPGMGASVGLLYSGKVSATLGGYVLIDGEKYILTSEHFVAETRELADRDDDYVTLTSPSREDLKKIENNLKHNKRDSDTEINSLTPRTYGDRDVPEHHFGDLNNLSHELRAAVSKNEEVRSLLDQVTREPLEYAVGTVKKLSQESRRGIISRSLADDLGLRNGELIVSHQMDWALIRANDHTAQAGENRHKYRSNKDAIDDGLYVDEKDRASQHGDVVYETCDAESGHTIYYVGQRSKHREGKVNLPVFINSSQTLVWGIMGLDGHDIPYSDVAGDSGAWVIRKEGNKLMGQVHSHDQGQVLFTPIDVIFDDLKDICESEVSLPPCHPGSDNMSSTISARQLCSVGQTPPARAYKFNISPPAESSTAPEISPIEIALQETRSHESSSVMPILRNTDTTHSQRSPPTLTSSPFSSSTTSEHPKSPQSTRNSNDFTDGQVNIKKLPPVSLPAVVGESTMSEISHLSLDQPEEDQPDESEPYTIPFKFQSLPGTTSSARTSTWPVTLRRSQVTKARPGSRFTHFRTFRKHAVPYSARAVLDEFARFARSIEDVTDIETISSPSDHEFSTLSMLKDVCKRDSFILEGRNVAA